MSNLFDVLEVMPERIFSGDQVTWELPDYLDDYAIADHSAAIEMREPVSDATVTINAVEVDDEYQFSTPANLEAGSWRWSLKVTQTSSGRILTLANGILVVSEAAADGDGLSHNEKMLTNIEKEMEARITGDGTARSEYAINGRNLQYIPIEELEKLKTRYSALVNQERRVASGQSATKKTRVCFND